MTRGERRVTSDEAITVDAAPSLAAEHRGGAEQQGDHHSRHSSLVTPAVEVTNLTREYRMGEETVRALRGVTFSIPDGGYVAIVGPSGCGKSTLLNLLGVIDRPTSGAVIVRGRDVSAMADR